MTRDEITQQIIAARLAKGLTWQELADAVGKPVVWTTAALLGQHPIPPDAGLKLVELLGLDEPVGPDARRPTHLKELIHEEFGDGIMSAINFGLNIEKKSNPAGDRVVVTFDGKFMPYDWTAADTAG
jgi:cyanate lyase